MIKLIGYTLILVVMPVLASAQIDDKKKEKALYEVTILGETAYFTDISKHDAPFGNRQAANITSAMMEKEGIFGVEQLNEGKTIRVYHLSYMDVDDIKSFIYPYADDFYMEERVVYLF